MGFNSPSTQFGISRSHGLERPPPHSIEAIKAKRLGGKKAPKKYRKYHKNKSTKKGKKSGGNIVTKAMHYIINAVTKVLP
ncbi:hypothetical protein SVAN01_06910 [Stagonosporopsis vannaccii]|nr:hypothetical protein SVAN01_06910 [Stagonosporopsis vannaccii]